MYHALELRMLAQLSLLLLALVAASAVSGKLIAEQQPMTGKVTGNQVSMSDDQIRDLNEILRQYEQNVDLLASRKALADALVSRVVGGGLNSNQLRAGSFDGLTAEELFGAEQQANDEQQSNEQQIADLQRQMQAYLAENNAGIAEKRAPNSSNSIASTYLLPTSVASYKRPMTYGKNSFDFGLGKRQSDSSQLYNLNGVNRFGEAANLVNPSNVVQSTGHQFGKRPNAHRFDFGLGKRKVSCYATLKASVRLKFSQN